MIRTFMHLFDIIFSKNEVSCCIDLFFSGGGEISSEVFRFVLPIRLSIVKLSLQFFISLTFRLVQDTILGAALDYKANSIFESNPKTPYFIIKIEQITYRVFWKVPRLCYSFRPSP